MSADGVGNTLGDSFGFGGPRLGEEEGISSFNPNRVLAPGGFFPPSTSHYRQEQQEKINVAPTELPDTVWRFSEDDVRIFPSEQPFGDDQPGYLIQALKDLMRMGSVRDGNEIKISREKTGFQAIKRDKNIFWRKQQQNPRPPVASLTPR